MLKLIRLEWKKNHIKAYIRSAAITAVLLGLFIFALAFLGIANDPDGTLDAAPGTDTISAPIELFTSMAFLIHTSVMLSAFIVSAYKNKTMNLMFSYPIKRQKILASQMIAVWTFNFLALTLTKLAIYLWVFLGARSMQSSFAIDSLRVSYPVACCVTKGEAGANTPLLQELQEANVQWTFECLHRGSLF